MFKQLHNDLLGVAKPQDGEPLMEVQFLGTGVSYRRGMQHMYAAIEQTRQALQEGRAPTAQLLLLEHSPVVTITRSPPPQGGLYPAVPVNSEYSGRPQCVASKPAQRGLVSKGSDEIETFRGAMGVESKGAQPPSVESESFEDQGVWQTNPRRGSLRLDRCALERLGLEFVQTDRGGDVTYHGPGQLVGYPIVALPHGANFVGVGRYLRRLEQALLNACCELGAPHCTLLSGKTGVWLEGGAPCAKTEAPPPSKLVAMGIGVDKDGITRHGFAMNVCADLALMQRCIVPCGLVGMGVANLDDALRQASAATAPVPHLCQVIAKHIAAGLGLRVRIKHPFCPQLSPRRH